MLTYIWGDEVLYPFPKGISPKVNVIALLDFKLASFNSAIQPLRHGNSYLLLLKYIRLYYSYGWLNFMAYQPL